MKIHYSKQKIRSILLFLIFLGLGVLLFLGYFIAKRLSNEMQGGQGNVLPPTSAPLNPARATPEQKIDILKNLAPTKPSQNLSQEKKFDILKQLAPKKIQQKSKGGTTPIQDMDYMQKKKILEQLSHQ